MSEHLPETAKAAPVVPPTEAAPVICTIATLSHQAPALCLAESFLRYHPQGQVHVLSLDGPAAPGFFPPAVTVWTSDAVAWPELPAMRARYSAFELCNALKPFLLRHLFDATKAAKLCYLDADTYFFGNIAAEIWAQLDDCAILLTPHLYRTPAEDDPDLMWRDVAVLQHGTFNAGFLGLRRSATTDEFLRWWRQRLITGSYHKIEQGFNCDQRWLDLLPGFYGTELSVSRHPGLNVAYWNLQERIIEVAGDSFTAAGQPLKFCHFSGYDFRLPHLITKNWTRFTFTNRPDVQPLFAEYQRAIVEARRRQAGSRQQVSGSKKVVSGRWSVKNCGLVQTSEQSNNRTNGQSNQWAVGSGRWAVKNCGMIQTSEQSNQWTIGQMNQRTNEPTDNRTIKQSNQWSVVRRIAGSRQMTVRQGAGCKSLPRARELMLHLRPYCPLPHL